MPFKLILQIVQFVVALLLIAAILLQRRSAGSLGAAFGGEGNVFAARRGAERWLFITTILLTIIFLASALVATSLLK